MTRPLTPTDEAVLRVLREKGKFAPGVWMSPWDKAMSDVLERLAKEGLCRRTETEDGDVYTPLVTP